MKVYLGEVIHPAAVELLEKHAEVVSPKDYSRAAFLEAIRDVDGLLARKIYLGAEEMDQAPRLKIIGRHGVGLDSVDLKAATRGGSWSSTPREQTRNRWRNWPSPFC